MSNLLNLGLGTAQAQGNILTDIASAQAEGLVGANNAQTQGAQSGLNFLAGIAGLF